MDRRLTFDGVADVYDRIRPTYPDKHFAQLFARLPATPSILEVGPGTGQATAALLARGAQVTAVELGPRLAEFLQRKFGDEDLDVINASFEQAAVAEQSFDAVVAATCYHWIDGPARVSRPLEALKPGGWLAVLDIIQVESHVDDGYFDRVQPIYDSFDNGKPSAWMPMTHDDVEPPIAPQLRASGRYQSVEVHRVVWDQTYTSAQYRDLLWSFSGTQAMAEPRRTDMVDQLIAVIDEEHGGVLTRPISATMTLAQTPA